MTEKITKFFLLILLIFIQSCSGGRIGNFLESSFKNTKKNEIQASQEIQNEDKVSEILMKNDIQPSKEIKIKDKDSDIIRKRDIQTSQEIKSEDKVSEILMKNNIQTSKEIKIKDKGSEISRKDDIKTKKKINKAKKLTRNKKKYKSQSYRIMVILKNVDPTSPSEDFTNVLKNSNVSFEIEKIERFEDSNTVNNKKEKDKF